jgi:hypothetical protein
MSFNLVADIQKFFPHLITLTKCLGYNHTQDHNLRCVCVCVFPVVNFISPHRTSYRVQDSKMPPLWEFLTPHTVVGEPLSLNDPTKISYTVYCISNPHPTITCILKTERGSSSETFYSKCPSTWYNVRINVSKTYHIRLHAQYMR